MGKDGGEDRDRYWGGDGGGVGGEKDTKRVRMVRAGTNTCTRTIVQE